jgi:hypothetical protein
VTGATEFDFGSNAGNRFPEGFNFIGILFKQVQHQS